MRNLRCGLFSGNVAVLDTDIVATLNVDARKEEIFPDLPHRFKKDEMQGITAFAAIPESS